MHGICWYIYALIVYWCCWIIRIGTGTFRMWVHWGKLFFQNEYYCKCFRQNCLSLSYLCDLTYSSQGQTLNTQTRKCSYSQCHLYTLWIPYELFTFSFESCELLHWLIHFMDLDKNVSKNCLWEYNFVCLRLQKLWLHKIQDSIRCVMKNWFIVVYNCF